MFSEDLLNNPSVKGKHKTFACLFGEKQTPFVAKSVLQKIRVAPRFLTGKLLVIWHISSHVTNVAPYIFLICRIGRSVSTYLRNQKKIFAREQLEVVQKFKYLYLVWFMRVKYQSENCTGKVSS